MGRLEAPAWLSAVRRWFNVEPVPVASDAERADWAHYLKTDKDAQVNATEVTDLLLREVRYLIDTKIDLIKGTDGKAAMAVTVLGGGVGVVSILGATQSALVLASKPWLLGPALLLVVLGVVLDLSCLARGYRYTSHMPRIDVYNSQAVLDDALMAGHVSTSIVEGYLTYSNELTALSARKSRLLEVATILLICGVFLFTINAVWANTHVARASDKADCRFATTSISCIIER
jgi:hypothetical protein